MSTRKTNITPKDSADLAEQIKEQTDAEMSTQFHETTEGDASNATVYQTDSESELSTTEGPEDGVEDTENTENGQTDSETDDGAGSGNLECHLVEDPKESNQPSSQTESKNDEEAENSLSHPKKRAQRKNQTADGTLSEQEPSQKEPQSNVSLTVEQENIDVQSPAPLRPQVISIGERRTVETNEDKERNDLLDLLESQKTGKILSGTVQGIERTDNDKHSFAVIYHGAFKVIIPIEEALEPPADFHGMPPETVLATMLTKRLGAEFDYIVKGIDREENVAVASRLDAMRAKRRLYYFRTDRDGNYQLYAGASAEARVVSVIRSGIFVDLFGLEVFIPLQELSYQRMMDAATQFQPGQRILVKLISVERSRSDLKVTASVKQAGVNPYAEAIKRYSPGNQYVGTVSLVDTNGVFVALDGGIDCLCSYPKRGRPPRGARVTVRIIGANQKTNRIWGAITHIAAAR